MKASRKADLVYYVHMKKFFVVYRVPVATMNEWMKTTKPEEMQAQGKKLESDMMAWMEKHASAIVEKGVPLGKTKSVTANGITDSRNDLNYYQIVEAESHEDAAKLFTDNPHLQIPTSFIEVIDIPQHGAIKIV